MQYTRLGTTGLEVSRLCLGCMSFGEQSKMFQWTLDEESSRTIIRQALEAGINFFDTANMYAFGSSEEFVGRALRDFADRDEIVLATKGFFNFGTGTNKPGLSRKSLFSQIDASLKRLGEDYVDLYQIHRWDPNTPIEETMEALHDIVKAGKARHIGASSMRAWQFAKAQHVAEKNGWTRFVSMQNQVSLLYREEEREMLPLCADQGVGVIPWSPLARGKLTREWNTDTARSTSDSAAIRRGNAMAEQDKLVHDQVSRIAAARGVGRAEVALAWVLQKSVVTSPIVGVTKQQHLTDALAALDVELTAEECKELEEPYTPRLPNDLGGMPPFKPTVTVRG